MGLVRLYWYLVCLFSHGAHSLATLADEIARRSLATVAERAGLRVAEMTIAEARGYLGARAADLIGAQVASALAEWGLPERLGPDLAHQATDALVSLLVRDRATDVLLGGTSRAA